MFEMTAYQIAGNGIAGISASFLSVIATWQEQLDWVVRISSAVVGLLIALVTLHRLLTQPKKSK